MAISQSTGGHHCASRGVHHQFHFHEFILPWIIAWADLLVAPSRENLHSEARASKQQKNETRASLLGILLEDTL
jgi:hypothetical protein